MLDAVRNGAVCIPSIADSPDQIVRFRNGTYHSSAIRFAQMRAMATGRLNGTEAVASEIVWNTGGSGNWEVVALFRLARGRAACNGVYWPAANLPDGGTMVDRIDIRNNRIYLYGADPLHGRTISTPLIITPSAFDRCRTRRR